jgi:hypothetical protein
MTTRSDQDINAGTSVHIRTTTTLVKGNSDNAMLEDERERQLTDLQYREGATIPDVQYPIVPSQDEVGALAYEQKGIHPRSNAPNESNRGLGDPTKPGMGGSKPADANDSVTGQKKAPTGVRFWISKQK